MKAKTVGKIVLGVITGTAVMVAGGAFAMIGTMTCIQAWDRNEAEYLKDLTDAVSKDPNSPPMERCIATALHSTFN